MSVDKKFLKNTQNSFQLLAQKGGRGRSATFDSMNTAANDGLGKFPARGVLYESCESQSGGGGGYGFTQASVKNADTFRGSYPEYVKYQQTNQCGGKRHRKSRRKRSMKKRRKSRRKRSMRKRRKSRKTKKDCCKCCKRMCGKSCKCSKKCKKKCKCKCPPCPRHRRRTRRTRKRIKQRGGSSQVFSSPNPQHNVPWATGPMSIQKLPPTCFDNYNHYTGEHR